MKNIQDSPCYLWVTPHPSIISSLSSELVLHPFVPVYVIGKLSTYKPYLVATMMPDTHPRYDKEPPEEYKKIAEEFVRSVQSPGDECDRDTFVLRRRTATVHEQLAAISERDLQNPHIRFFNEHNPGWKEVRSKIVGSEFKYLLFRCQGDQLVALVRMTLKGLLLHLVKVTIRQFKPSSVGKPLQFCIITALFLASMYNGTSE